MLFRSTVSRCEYVKNKTDHRFPPLLPVTLFMVIGILVGNRYPFSLGILAPGCLILLISICFFFLKLKPFVISICCIALFFGFFSSARMLNPPGSLASISQFTDSSKYTITGKIVSFSKDYQRKKRVTLSCDMVEKKGLRPVRVQGRILLNIYYRQGQILQYGDLIQFKSPLKPIRNFSNPNGFDYENYMLYAGVYGDRKSGV